MTGPLEKVLYTARAIAEGGLGAIPGDAYGLQVDLVVALPDIDRQLAEELATKAHRICPHSNATRDTIEVGVTVA